MTGLDILNPLSILGIPMELETPEGVDIGTRLKELKEEWKDCIRCSLGCKAYSHIIYEIIPIGSATLAPRLMMVGEGPGEAENLLGRPFVGPAGRLLRSAIIEAGGADIPICLTNLVACRPLDVISGRNRKPEHTEMLACRPRLQELVKIMQPKAILALGRIPAEELYPTLDGVDVETVMIHFYHPAYILRKGGKNSPDYIEYVNQFRKVFENELQ